MGTMGYYQNLELEVIVPRDGLIALHRTAIEAHNAHMAVVEHNRGLPSGSEGRIAPDIMESTDERYYTVQTGELFVFIDYTEGLFRYSIESKNIIRELPTIPGYVVLLRQLLAMEWPNSPEWGGVEMLIAEDTEDDFHRFVTYRFGPAGAANPHENNSYRLLG